MRYLPPSPDFSLKIATAFSHLEANRQLPQKRVCINPVKAAARGTYNTVYASPYRLAMPTLLQTMSKTRPGPLLVNIVPSVESLEGSVWTTPERSVGISYSRSVPARW